MAIVLYGYRLKTNESGISFSVSLELRQLESASMLIGPLLKEVIKTIIKSGWKSTLTVSNFKKWLLESKTSRFGPSRDGKLPKLFEHGVIFLTIRKTNKGIRSCYTSVMHIN